MKTMITKRLIYLLSFFLLSSNFALAADWYVDTTGNDGNVGSFASPVLTITQGVVLASAGDTVYVMPGTYPAVTIAKSGTPENYITIKSYSAVVGSYAVIDAGGVYGDQNKNGFNINGEDWLKFENLKLRNCWRFGWYGTGNKYIWIKNCDIIGSGILTKLIGSGSHHVLLEENEWNKYQPMWDTMPWQTAHDDYGDANGSMINFISEGNRGNYVARNNEVYYAYNPFRIEAQAVGDLANIEIYGNNIHHCIDNAIEPEGVVFNLHVYHNIFDQIGGGLLSLDNVNGGEIWFYGNVGYYDWNDEPGAYIGWDRTRRVVKFTNTGDNMLDDTVRLFHNTYYYREFQESGSNNLNSNILHYNNIGVFWSQGWGFGGLNESNNDFDNDLSYGINPSGSLSFPNVYGWEANGVEAAPGLVNPAGGDYSLAVGSNAEDAGRTITGFTQSYDGTAPDIGAYEGDTLVEGPPFYVQEPVGGLGYVEKPRITRHRVSGTSLTVFWSWALTAASFDKDDIVLTADSVAVTVNSISLTGSDRELIINTATDLSSAELALSFSTLPTGTNSEPATMWASTVGTVTAAATPTAPEVSSASIDGKVVVINFSVACIRGSGYNDTDWDLNMSITGDDAGVAYVSGDGTTQWIMEATNAAAPGEVITLDTNGDTDGVKDASGNVLAAFEAEAVTNNTALPAAPGSANPPRLCGIFVK